MGDDSKKMCGGCSGAAWWATLVVAVLAVPSFGVVVAAATPFKGVGQLAVFVLACWLCTYLGMKVMQMPVMSKKIGSSKKDVS